MLGLVKANILPNTNVTMNTTVGELEDQLQGFLAPFGINASQVLEQFVGRPLAPSLNVNDLVVQFADTLASALVVNRDYTGNMPLTTNFV
jgi:hypothetical protein